MHLDDTNYKTYMDDVVSDHFDLTVTLYQLFRNLSIFHIFLFAISYLTMLQFKEKDRTESIPHFWSAGADGKQSLRNPASW